jgi:integrase
MVALTITGTVVPEARKGGRVWVARYRLASTGAFTRKTLGPAWVRDSGRRTPRGAVVWRAAPGTKPDGYLTPSEAATELSRLIDAERALLDGRPLIVTAGKATFGDATDEWGRYVTVEKQLAAGTLRRYRGIVDVHLIPEFGRDTPLRAIAWERIDAYRDRLLDEDALSRDSMRQAFVALNGIFKRAVRKRWLSYNPMADVEPIPTPQSSGDFNVLTAVQVEAVARAAESAWEPVLPGNRKGTRVSEERARAWTEQRRLAARMHGAVIRVAAHTGLRLGELRALRWRDVDWGNGVIHVRLNSPVSAPADEPEKAPKSGKTRSVPITDVTARELNDLSRREHFVGLDDYVFPSATGAIVDGKDLRDAFYEALASAGLGRLRGQETPIVFHDLRHTFGTLAVGVFPLSDVKEMMGHADLQTTMRYVHYVPRHDAARRLSQAFAVETGAAELAEVA